MHFMLIFVIARLVVAGSPAGPRTDSGRAGGFPRFESWRVFVACWERRPVAAPTAAFAADSRDGEGRSMNKVALGAGVVTVLCGSSCAANQETEILGEGAGLPVDATDAVSLDR